MQAYRIKTSRIIHPFDEPAVELYVATRSVRQWQEDACSGCGLDLIDLEEVTELPSAPCIVFFDDVFFTEMALRHFTADAMSSDEDIALAMPDCHAARAVEPAGDIKRGEHDSFIFDVFALKSGRKFQSRDELRNQCVPKIQRMRAAPITVRVPNFNDGPGLVDVEITARVVAHIRHWVHVLRVSQMSVAVLLLDAFRQQPSRIIRTKWRKRLGRSYQDLRNFIHPSANIHPTAYIENSIVGENCIIGPHSHVHSSVLGSGVNIGDHVNLMSCTLAHGVQVLRTSDLAYCCAMPGANLSSQKVQLSLFGRDVFLTSYAKILDAKLQGSVHIEHDGQFIDLKTSFLGGCIGHRSILGANTTLQVGRAIPCDVTVVGDPNQVISRIEDYEHGVILTIKDGILVPLSTLSRETV